MKRLDINKFLEENAISIVIGENEYTIKDLAIKDAEELAVETSDKKEVLARIIGCTKAELEPYGAIGIMQIANFINENLVPKVSQ